eukprot:SAG25_NODE_5625_length_637_cov_0.814126_1_plen_23_part_01
MARRIPIGTLHLISHEGINSLLP